MESLITQKYWCAHSVQCEFVFISTLLISLYNTNMMMIASFFFVIGIFFYFFLVQISVLLSINNIYMIRFSSTLVYGHITGMNEISK